MRGRSLVVGFVVVMVVGITAVAGCANDPVGVVIDGDRVRPVAVPSAVVGPYDAVVDVGTQVTDELDESFTAYVHYEGPTARGFSAVAPATRIWFDRAGRPVLAARGQGPVVTIEQMVSFRPVTRPRARWFRSTS